MFLPLLFKESLLLITTEKNKLEILFFILYF